MSAFETIPVGPGAALHRLAVDRFKSVTCRAIFHLPLTDRAAEVALLPPLLRRGSRLHPDLVAIGRRLDDLYGAALDGDVSRMAERQILDLAVDLVAPKHLPGRADVLREGLAFLREILLDPRLDGDRFPADVFDQERENHARMVEGLRDDRISYATERCLSKMCEGEPYANYPYGTPETIRRLENEEVVARWRAILSTAPLDLYAVGPADPEVLEEEARALAESLGPRRVETPPEPVAHPRRAPRTIVEEMEVDQVKLVLGFRADVVRGREEDPGMVLFAALLGGGPFSKLFRKVREESSLAYYASAALERAKGLLLVQAGVQRENEEKAIALSLEQVAAIGRGEIEADELAAAKKAIRMRLRGLEDSPSGLIAYAVERGLLGRSPLAEAEARAVEKAGADAVVAAAGRVRLDTIYALRPARRAA